MLADAILIAHAALVLFVVASLLLILVGGARGWHWIRNRWFRFAHLTIIVFVAVQAWLGRLCPLTIWEQALREHAGETGHAGSFIEYWLSRLLFFEAPSWMFALVYTGFAGLVLLAWHLFPPRRDR